MCEGVCGGGKVDGKSIDPDFVMGLRLYHSYSNDDSRMGLGLRLTPVWND